jgi:hypothetical protein
MEAGNLVFEVPMMAYLLAAKKNLTVSCFLAGLGINRAPRFCPSFVHYGQ